MKNKTVLAVLCAVLGIFVMGDKVNASLIIGGLLILVGVRQVTKPPKGASTDV